MKGTHPRGSRNLWSNPQTKKSSWICSSSHSRLNTQVSLSDRKLTLVRHKISQTKYTVSRSFHQQFLCHNVRLHMFHKTTILINMHCQKSVTNIMKNFEIALKFNPRAEKYTESTLRCLRRSTCLTCIALPSFPTPPFLPSFFFVQNASTPLGSNLIVNMTRKVADVITQASSSNSEYLPVSRNDVD